MDASKEIGYVNNLAKIVYVFNSTNDKRYCVNGNTIGYAKGNVDLGSDSDVSNCIDYIRSHKCNYLHDILKNYRYAKVLSATGKQKSILNKLLERWKMNG